MPEVTNTDGFEERADAAVRLWEDTKAQVRAEQVICRDHVRDDPLGVHPVGVH